jgi:hypothetical protein
MPIYVFKLFVRYLWAKDIGLDWRANLSSCCKGRLSVWPAGNIVDLQLKNVSERRPNMKLKTHSCFCAALFFIGLFVLFSPCAVLADQQEISVGYGLATFNKGAGLGHLHEDDYYDFAQVAYGYEKTLSGKFNVLIEPFVAIVNRPTSGLDGGLTVNARYYFGERNHRGFFATVGAGGAYTSVAFEEQGTHGLFILQGGIGYKWERLFLEGRFKHYSNGGLASPNQSVNASIVSIGFAF